jgi:hypothetical protein
MAAQATVRHQLKQTYVRVLKSEHAIPTEASMAKEVRHALDQATFKGVFYRDLSIEDRKLVLKSTSLYKAPQR